MTDLDLLKRLKEYAEGGASWLPNDQPLGQAAKDACTTLHTHLTDLVNKVLAPILNRTNDRQMETFTMHDATHGLKVAHLMWHTLTEERRKRLTPAEIGLMVATAHFHDMGMSLSPERRKERLAPDSDLWEKVEIMGWTHLQALEQETMDAALPEAQRKLARQRLQQAEEALLCIDTRDRHADAERYAEILQELREMAAADRRVPDMDTCLIYHQDSFLEKMIDLCVSHNQDASYLSDMDAQHTGRKRFPSDYPVGDCTADLLMVAAALRMADILDFDRERTPVALYHYLLPVSLGVLENRSNLEWNKHMDISFWEIEADGVLFRGRCDNHVVHHAIVQFGQEIQVEIDKTQRVFAETKEAWPFLLQPRVETKIVEQGGYRYAPYRFQLDDERVYQLLMGQAIYENPLDALRELIQNAVDACMLRDRLETMNEPHHIPNRRGRITITYEEPTTACPMPRLTVEDTGTGMDRRVLERWFLKVGNSYYRSAEFTQERIRLRKQGLDFAPVSEFGIGFLATFLLADRVEVETAHWASNDTVKRTLTIDGPTRLIKVNEQRQDGYRRFKGTRITLVLTKGGRNGKAPTWEDVVNYVQKVCVELPYVLELKHLDGAGATHTVAVEPQPPTCRVPTWLEPFALRIPVQDRQLGLEGEMVLINVMEQDRRRSSATASVQVREQKWLPSSLLRGGFHVADVFLGHGFVGCQLRLTWEGMTNRRYLTTTLARTSLPNLKQIQTACVRTAFKYVLHHRDELPPGALSSLNSSLDVDWSWVKEQDGFTWYQLLRKEWAAELDGGEPQLEAWENGTGEPLSAPDLGGIQNTLLIGLLAVFTKPVVQADGGLLLPPPEIDWREKLCIKADFFTDFGWDSFVAFDRRIQHLMIYDNDDDTFLNPAYREVLSVFTDSEIVHLCFILGQVAYLIRIESPMELSPSQAQLIRRLQALVPDALFGDADKSWPLSSIVFED